MTNPRPLSRFVEFPGCRRFARRDSLLAARGCSRSTRTGDASRGSAGHPLELVTGSAHALITPEERDAAMDLLARARLNIRLHAAGVPPYDMKVSFTSTGARNSKATARWENYAGPVLRWTARLASSSQMHIVSGGQDVRDNSKEPGAAARTTGSRRNLSADRARARNGMIAADGAARGTGNGQATHMPALLVKRATKPMPRQWVETEFCIDPEWALLHSWSVAPGIYVNYDYTDAIQYHGHTLARKFTSSREKNPCWRFTLTA